MRAVSALGALVLTTFLMSGQGNGQQSFVAIVKTSDGANLRLTGPTYVYSESHTAPGYIIGPSVTEKHGDMEHLPVTMAFGTVFVPFQLVKAVSSVRVAGKNPTAQLQVTVTLTDGTLLSGNLGAGLGRSQQLSGQGGFGTLDVDLAKIAEMTFESIASESRTFKPPRQKAGGPFTVSAGGTSLQLREVLGVATFDDRGNTFKVAKLDVGGVSFEPDFSKISSISVTAPPQNSSQDANAEVVSSSGEKLVGPLKGWQTGLLAESKIGFVFIDMRKTVRITNQ